MGKDTTPIIIDVCKTRPSFHGPLVHRNETAHDCPEITPKRHTIVGPKLHAS